MGKALIIPGVIFSDAGFGQVTLPGYVPITGIGISGPNSVSGGTNAARYVPYFIPANTTQRSFSWSIVSGGSYASINSSTGWLSIVVGASSSSITIRVTSQDNNSVYAEKSVSVTYVPEIEYVASKGSEGIPYISTINPSGTYNYEMVFMVEDAVNSDLFGTRKSSSSQILRFFGEPSTNKFRWQKSTGGSSGTDLNHTIQTGKKYKIIFTTASSNGAKLYEVVDGSDTLLVQGGNLSASVSSTVPIFLGALNNNGTPVAFKDAKLRIYNFKVYTSSQDVLDLVPYFDSVNSRPALKDTLTNNIYQYSTSGTATLYYKVVGETEQSIEIS